MSDLMAELDDGNCQRCDPCDCDCPERALSDWHGWGSDGKAVHIGPLPGRKSICLYVVDGSVMRTLAFFRSEKEAAEALRWIDWLANLDVRQP